MSSLVQLIAPWIEEAHQERLALIEDDSRWTYCELWARMNRVAAHLKQDLQIASGDRVATMFWNQKEFLVTFFALRQLGAVVVPINLQFPESDMAFVMQDAKVKAIVGASDLLQKLLKAVPPAMMPLVVTDSLLTAPGAETPFPCLEDWMVDESIAIPDFAKELSPNVSEQLAVLLYTSGTTGQPKGVMLSEFNLCQNLEGIHPRIQLRSDDRGLLALPFFHAFGLIFGLYLLKAGSATVLVPRFMPKAILKALAVNQVTVLPLVPTMFNLLLEGSRSMGAEPFAHLRLCVSGGASLPTELLGRIEEGLNITVLEGYGLTETSPVVAVNDPLHGSVPGAVGRPLQNLAVKLVDDQGQDVPVISGEPSGQGEIWVKGPSVMMGYYNRPDETEKVLDSEGWFRTGDIGDFDGEGNLRISGGRKKDLIIKAGENISPLRIESVIYQHPSVMEATVIGVPDPKAGEAILACIQFRPDESATESELKTFCRQELPPFMVPDVFRVYDELPKNVNGKILKKVLRHENPTLEVARSGPVHTTGEASKVANKPAPVS